MTSGYVPARGPWDVDATLASLAQHDVPGVHRTEGRTHTRVLAVGRQHLLIRLHLEEPGVRWQACCSGADGIDPALIQGLVTWWFDLATDAAAIDEVLEADAHVGDHVRRRPGVRITRHPDIREGVLTTILGQQVSLAAARTFTGRLAAAYGTEIDHTACSEDSCAATASAPTRAFPESHRLVQIPQEPLRRTIGLTGARARTLQAAAALLADQAAGKPAFQPAPHSPVSGSLDLPLAGAVLDDLAKLPGIGPWTISILALWAAGDADALPASDGVLRRALGGIGPREVTALAESWRPYRSYAVVRLWAQATMS